MPEGLQSGSEKHEKPIGPPKIEGMLPTAEQAEPLRPGEKDPAQVLEAARADIQETTESQVNPVEQLQAAEAASETAATSQPAHINSELRSAGLQRQLITIRRQLSLPQRTLSKVVHQPVIRAMSEPVGKTVSRPSGLLGGGLVAFLGTSAYLYVAKHSGMRYQYSMFLLLFFGGFVVGLFLELLVRTATASRRRAND